MHHFNLMFFAKSTQDKMFQKNKQKQRSRRIIFLIIVEFDT